MSKSKVYRPKGSSNIPSAPRYDPDTGEPVQVDKREALRQWFKDSKVDRIAEDEGYSVSIDPKQAVYAKKTKKDK